ECSELVADDGQMKRTTMMIRRIHGAVQTGRGGGDDCANGVDITHDDRRGDVVSRTVRQEIVNQLAIQGAREHRGPSDDLEFVIVAGADGVGTMLDETAHDAERS